MGLRRLFDYDSHSFQVNFFFPSRQEKDMRQLSNIEVYSFKVWKDDSHI